MKKIAVVALAALLVVPVLASARHLVVSDPDDTRGLLDIRRTEVGGSRNSPRWSVSTYATWSVREVWDTGFVLVRIDTFGTSRADYYAMVRSNGRALVAHLFRDRKKRRDHRLRRLPVTREDRRNVTITIDMRRLKRRNSRVYSWFVQTLFASDNCRSTCIDRAPDRGTISEPGARPSPTPSVTVTPLPTTTP